LGQLPFDLNVNSRKSWLGLHGVIDVAVARTAIFTSRLFGFDEELCLAFLSACWKSISAAAQARSLDKEAPFLERKERVL
jgi:hypothetical protein